MTVASGSTEGLYTEGNGNIKYSWGDVESRTVLTPQTSDGEKIIIIVTNVILC